MVFVCKFLFQFASVNIIVFGPITRHIYGLIQRIFYEFQLSAC